MFANVATDDAAFDRLCLQGKLVESRDLARFARPSLQAFFDDTNPVFGYDAEFFRWYTLDGTVRSRPLDLDELIQCLVDAYGFDAETAERVAIFESRARRGDRALWEVAMREYGQDLARFIEMEEGTLFDL